MAGHAYHHGNLRPALVAAALERIESHGAEGVTLRAVAAQVGVSHAAPYAHFRDKNALLAAVAAAGFRELHARLRAGRKAQRKGSGNALARMGMVYVAFAREHPALYALMFGRDVGQARSEEFDEASEGAWRELQETVAADVVPSHARTAAVAAWSLVHGLASLLTTGRIRVDGGEAALVEQVTQWFAGRLSGRGRD